MADKAPLSVKEAREKLGWTQEDLARETSLSVSTISHIETGATKPNKATMKLISQALNAKTGEIIAVRIPAESSEQ